MQPVRIRRIRGQGMTEYIIIVALIAVAAIGVYRLFGDTVREQMAGLAKELSGESGKGARDAAKTSADNAEKAATAEKDLSNYYDGNQK
ncbi:pilus assembly protein [Marinobacter guineae]|jgi:Flp pilus assembly pilin Flp|uniref:Pilus assembly protein n=1 Tax=Marinobacter guineae TaxID=432303 RepID=A0A2G1VEK0_9GAMM|nr:pilus assembly protein [Marinobacter guineae]PHQ25164.1 pilus assembly protein [Marinobacter guineae]